MNTKPYRLHHGDCLAVLKTFADNSIDSIVTDPPYGLSFMGKKWDYDVPSTEIWAECLRVLKPGGHLLAFAGTRTQHRMAVRIEDAGFEIRDMIAWIYGSGFPKSMDVSKAIDKAAGADREVIGTRSSYRPNSNAEREPEGFQDRSDGAITAPATDAARQWQGWGTALKPALEPITVARKPLIGTVAANVLMHGTGAINIDGCRVGTESVSTHSRGSNAAFPKRPGESTVEESGRTVDQRDKLGHDERTGRWPANLIHDGSDEVVALFPAQAGASAPVKGTEASKASVGEITGKRDRVEGAFHADSGSAARFFYCAKTSRKDRNEGMIDPGPQFKRGTTLRQVENTATTGNNHPTVKPTDLMAYLCRLVTPAGGVVLDPFMGSGSTGKAAMREGFEFIGCELDEAYLAIAAARIEHEFAKVPAVVPPNQAELFATS
ncbi:DNA-methyltransferase [Pseudomonas sp.]|uniref:DNA-methyltransferase n=1 Tax=Pseudomonas sp. TaxID=306 RepID=UPI003FD77499